MNEKEIAKAENELAHLAKVVKKAHGYGTATPKPLEWLSCNDCERIHGEYFCRKHTNDRTFCEWQIRSALEWAEEMVADNRETPRPHSEFNRGLIAAIDTYRKAFSAVLKKKVKP